MCCVLFLSCTGTEPEPAYKEPATLLPTEYTYKAIATLIDDDTASDDAIETIKTLANRQGIKITFACVTDRLNTDSRRWKLLEYQKDSFNIVSHSVTHSAGIWQKGNATWDMKQVEIEMQSSLARLKNEGFKNSDFFVYPYGQFPDSVLEKITALTKKYYRAGINSSTGLANYPPYTDRYYLNRILISKNKKIDDLKKTVDDAIAKGGWMIFLTHSNNSNEFDANYTEEIIEYIQSKGVKFFTLEEAWAHKGVLYK